MNVDTYLEAKAAGTVELRKVGKDRVVVFTANFNPATAERLDDTIDDLNLNGIANDLKNVDDAIAQNQRIRENLVALRDDITALLEAPEKLASAAKSKDK